MVRFTGMLIAIVLLILTIPASARLSGDVTIQKVHRHYSTALSDLTPILRKKVVEIKDSCHSQIVSGYRPGARIAGTGHPSLHSVYPSKAADMVGNPQCIYSHLKGWLGGYSIDYARVRHVHISYSPPGSGYLSGREWHARFVHGGSHHHRYATRTHKRHHRLASR